MQPDACMRALISTRVSESVNACRSYMHLDHFILIYMIAQKSIEFAIQMSVLLADHIFLFLFCPLTRLPCQLP